MVEHFLGKEEVVSSSLIDSSEKVAPSRSGWRIPYSRASPERNAMNELLPIFPPQAGSRRPLVIAGPCSAETEEQTVASARALATVCSSVSALHGPAMTSGRRLPACGGKIGRSSFMAFRSGEARLYGMRHPDRDGATFSELSMRLELTTSSLPRKCSTTELRQHSLFKSDAKVHKKNEKTKKLCDFHNIFLPLLANNRLNR